MVACLTETSSLLRTTVIIPQRNTRNCTPESANFAAMPLEAVCRTAVRVAPLIGPVLI